MNDRDSDSVARQNLDGAMNDIHARQQFPRGRNSVVDILIRPMVARLCPSSIPSLGSTIGYVSVYSPFYVRITYTNFSTTAWKCLCSHTLDKLLYPFLHFELSVKSPCLLGPSFGPCFMPGANFSISCKVSKTGYHLN